MAKQRHRAKHQKRHENGAAPPLAAEDADTPKISTGIVSGNTSTAMNEAAAPERHGQRRADVRRSRCSAGVPAASVAATSAERRRRHRQHQAEDRRDDDQGSALVVQCAAHLTSTTSSSGSGPSTITSSEPSS